MPIPRLTRRFPTIISLPLGKAIVLTLGMSSTGVPCTHSGICLEWRAPNQALTRRSPILTNIYMILLIWTACFFAVHKLGIQSAWCDRAITETGKIYWSSSGLRLCCKNLPLSEAYLPGGLWRSKRVMCVDGRRNPLFGAFHQTQCEQHMENSTRDPWS